MPKIKGREFTVAGPLARAGNRDVTPRYKVQGSETIFDTLDDAIRWAEKHPRAKYDGGDAPAAA